jgi:hypothetical protein
MPDGAPPQHESRVLPLAQHWERGPGGEGLFTGGTEARRRWKYMEAYHSFLCASVPVW